MKRVVLCVDDFGLKPAVNEAVAELVDAGLVTATACMSQGPAWREGAALLSGPRRERLDVGLHLNLTEAFPAFPAFEGGLGGQRGAGRANLAMPLPHLVARALVRTLDASQLRHAVCAQLDAFEAVWGAPPDFVDGHQHVHQLPQVREVLLAELRHRYGRGEHGPMPWLRLTSAPSMTDWRGGGSLGFKARLIGWLGAREFARQARAAGFRLNGALLGVYGFDAEPADFAHRLQQWLEMAREGDVLMMHPARPVDGRARHGADAIAAAREVEFAVLRDQGAELLARAGVRGARLGDLSSILTG